MVAGIFIERLISSCWVGLVTQIPRSPVLSILITSTGTTFDVLFRFANTISPCVFHVVEVVKNQISAGAYHAAPIALFQKPID